MVLEIAKKVSLENMRVSRVVVISGLLTFMYCIEFCIGIRTVYYTFKLWNDPLTQSQEKPVSWTLCVACLFTATLTAFTVNILSAIWEQKQLEEKEKEKSAILFAFHILIGGMIWRYINLWYIESKEYQKKSALLLTMTKFFFTQTFTIPMLIVHVSVMGNLEEIVFDICPIFCVSLNLILTCTMFAWCSKEAEELKKWNFETVDLVPLIFQSPSTVTKEDCAKVRKDSTGKEIVSKYETNGSNCENELEEMVIKSIVFFQSFGFSLGRILALGILLKLAGIYAVSIMFLQILISVVYLKFQAPKFVSDSLPKWRQLTRLGFMSYILIFEWHLNRDPRTAYDFSTNMKHSILYYCLATVESVFYLVTWAITTSYTSKSEPLAVRRQQNKFCRIILVIGSFALVLSLTIHIVLLFWRSRKISVFFHSIKSRYETTKLRLSQYGCKKVKEEVQGSPPKRSRLSHVDISSPIPINKNNTNFSEKLGELEKHNSYRDLSEPLDEEIEIYFRKCQNRSKNNDVDETYDDTEQGAMSEEVTVASNRRVFVKTIDYALSQRENDLQQNAADNYENPATIIPTEANISFNETNQDEREEAEKSAKSKTSLFSNISEQWGKMSSVPLKFAGTVKDQYQKRKDQFQNFRSASSDSKKTDTPVKTPKSSLKSPSNNKASNSVENISNEAIDEVEGYFVGDSRCYEIESSEPDPTVNPRRIRFTDETTSQLKSFGQEIDDEIVINSDTVHKEGDSPCPCYICKTLGDGRFRRRRSSSVPSGDRKVKKAEGGYESNQNLSRYMSTPNISQDLCDKYDTKSKDLKRISPSKMARSVFNLSQLSLNNRIEHYV